MIDGQTTQTSPAETAPAFDASLIRIITIVVLFTVAGTLLLFSLALIKDVETLRSAPELVWNFICGIPASDGPELPMILTLATLFFLGGMMASGWHLYRSRQERRTAH